MPLKKYYALIVRARKALALDDERKNENGLNVHFCQSEDRGKTKFLKNETLPVLTKRGQEARVLCAKSGDDLKAAEG